MNTYTHNAADISISVEMEAQLDAPNHYTGRVISNELGEVLNSFEGGSITAVLDLSAHAAAQHVSDGEFVHVTLRTPARTACAATITQGWTRDRAERLANHLLTVVE